MELEMISQNCKLKLYYPLLLSQLYIADDTLAQLQIETSLYLNRKHLDQS